MQVTLDADLVVFFMRHAYLRLLGGRLDMDDEGAAGDYSLDRVDQLELNLGT